MIRQGSDLLSLDRSPGSSRSPTRKSWISSSKSPLFTEMSDASSSNPLDSVPYSSQSSNISQASPIDDNTHAPDINLHIDFDAIYSEDKKKHHNIPVEIKEKRSARPSIASTTVESQEMMKKIRPNILSSTDPVNVQLFLQTYSNYLRSGGDAPIQSFLSHTILESLLYELQQGQYHATYESVSDIYSADSEILYHALAERYVVLDTMTLKQAMENITMTAKLTHDTLNEYCSRYQQLAEFYLSEDDHEEFDSFILTYFIDHIQPLLLQQLVRNSEPMSLDDGIRRLREQGSQLLSLQQMMDLAQAYQAKNPSQSQIPIIPTDWHKYQPGGGSSIAATLATSSASPMVVMLQSSMSDDRYSIGPVKSSVDIASNLGQLSISFFRQAGAGPAGLMNMIPCNTKVTLTNPQSPHDAVSLSQPTHQCTISFPLDLSLVSSAAVTKVSQAPTTIAPLVEQAEDIIQAAKLEAQRILVDAYEQRKSAKLREVEVKEEISREYESLKLMKLEAQHHQELMEIEKLLLEKDRKQQSQLSATVADSFSYHRPAASPSSMMMSSPMKSSTSFKSSSENIQRSSPQSPGDTKHSMMRSFDISAIESSFSTSPKQLQQQHSPVTLTNTHFSLSDQLRQRQEEEAVLEEAIRRKLQSEAFEAEQRQQELQRIEQEIILKREQHQQKKLLALKNQVRQSYEMPTINAAKLSQSYEKLPTLHIDPSYDELYLQSHPHPAPANVGSPSPSASSSSSMMSSPSPSPLMLSPSMMNTKKSPMHHSLNRTSSFSLSSASATTISASASVNMKLNSPQLERRSSTGSLLSNASSSSTVNSAANSPGVGKKGYTPKSYAFGKEGLLFPADASKNAAIFGSSSAGSILTTSSSSNPSPPVTIMDQVLELFGKASRILLSFKCNKKSAEIFSTRLQRSASILIRLQKTYRQFKLSELSQYLSELGHVLALISQDFVPMTRTGYLSYLLRGSMIKVRFQQYDRMMMKIMNQIAELMIAAMDHRNITLEVIYQDFQILDSSAIRLAHQDKLALKSLARYLQADIEDFEEVSLAGCQVSISFAC
jgi:hypothetical protein